MSSDDAATPRWARLHACCRAFDTPTSLHQPPSRTAHGCSPSTPAGPSQPGPPNNENKTAVTIHLTPRAFPVELYQKVLHSPRVASSHDSLHTSRKQQPSMNTSLTAVKYCPRRPASVRNDSGDRHAVGAISLVYTGSRSQEQSARSRQQRRYRCGVKTSVILYKIKY